MTYSDNILPEDFSEKFCTNFLDELYHNSFVDSSFLSLAFIFAALSERKVSKLKIARLSKYSF